MWPVVGQPCDEQIIESRPPTAPCSKAHGRWVLAATILASSMAFIDGTVVNVALPALQTNFNATAVDVQWVIEAYSLLLSALLLIGGSLGDHYGRRRIFLIGVALFASASAACGFAADIHQLIIARALQGLGAALLVPGSLAIISSSFSEKERGRAIGTWSGSSAMTTAVGPVIGGWLVEHVSWRAVFLINIPLALVVIVISLRHVPKNSERDTARVDWPGAILAALGLGVLIYGLIESSRLGFNNRSIIVFLVAAAVLILSFLIVEARLSHPMLPLGLFRSRVFTAANLLTFLLYAALGGTFFFLPLNLIQVQHYSATAAGAALLPFILLISFLSRWSGGFVAKYGSKLPLVVGPLIAASGFVLFMLPGIGGSYWVTFFPPIVVLGLGMAITVASLTTSVMNSVMQSRVGIASGVNNAVARTGGLVAIAVFGVVMLHIFDAQLGYRLALWNVPPSASQSLRVQRTKLAGATFKDQDPAVRRLMRRVVEESFVSGFRLIMGIGAACAITGAGTALILLRPRNATTMKS